MTDVLLEYVASSGNVYDLKSRGLIRTKTANYHKWNWGVNGTALQYGTRVSGFTRDAAVYSTRLVFDGALATRKELIENLHEDFELDVRNMTPGRINWGDYWIDAFIQASSTEPDPVMYWTDNDIDIYCPHPFWTRELTRQFTVQDAETESGFLEYAFDYDYDYFAGQTGMEIWITHNPFPSDFRMVIYGPVADPRVIVNGYPYQVFDTLEPAEYIIIDSRQHTVVKYLANGRTANIFDKRNKVESVFQQIPAGDLIVNWTGTFGFDVTLFIERSEPRWTL